MTAEEVLKKHYLKMTSDEEGWEEFDEDIRSKECMLNAMREYAHKIAKEALINASESCSRHFYENGYSMDYLEQQSITTDSNIPNLK